MTLLETILNAIKEEFNLKSIDPNCFPEEDLEIIKAEDLSKIPAIHACPDDDFLWIGEDTPEETDEYECYDLITLGEETNYLNIYLYNVI